VNERGGSSQAGLLPFSGRTPAFQTLIVASAESRRMPSLNENRTRAVVALALLAALTLLYSIVVLGAVQVWLSAWVGVATTLFFLYMLWRFVRAHERIAAALESDAAETTERGPGES